MAEGTSSEPPIGPDEKKIRDEVKGRSRQIDVEETWVLTSGRRLRRPRYQATIENAYLEKSRTVVERSVAELEQECRRTLDHWDELEVIRKTGIAERRRNELGAKEHCRRLHAAVVRNAERVCVANLGCNSRAAAGSRSHFLPLHTRQVAVVSYARTYLPSGLGNEMRRAAS